MQLFRTLLAHEGAAPRLELSLVFCGDALIHELNREYRGKDQPTDVLSFPQERERGLLGDVIISVPTALRQAEAREQSLMVETEWLFLHGLLHLLGYDDETEEGAADMDRRARAVQTHLAEVA